MLNHTKHKKILLILTLALVLSASINAQEVRIIDNKGTLHTVNQNLVPTVAQVVNSSIISTPSNTSFISIPFSTIPNLVRGNISANTSGITIQETALYKVTFNCNVEIQNITNINTSKSLLTVLGLSVLGDITTTLQSQTTGAVFRLTNNGIEIPNTFVYALETYSSTTKTISFSKILNFNSGDIISLQLRRYNASYTVSISANGSNLIIEKL